MYKKIIIAIWTIFILGLIALPTWVFMVSSNFQGWFGGMPDHQTLENPESSLASELFTSDGKLLGKYYRQNRTPVTYDELSPNMVNALLAAEDIRFQQHSGIDLEATLRVVRGLLTFNTNLGGGSTITQQLAKNLFKTRGASFQGSLTKKNRLIRLVVSKTKEWIISVKLERSYTKEEIMAMYLNTIEFGGNAYGIRVAARTFFNIPQDSLNIQQSAMLVGMLNAPSRFNPVRNPERAMRKRTEILYSMYNFKFLSREEYDSIKTLPFGLEYKVANHNEGQATYFRSQARNQLMKWCEENGYDLFADGLKIYTTIDSRLQEYAEEAMEEQMKSLQKKFFDHWKGRNPWVDENGREMKNFIEDRAKLTDQYKSLVAKYGANSDSVDIMMNTPQPIKVFSWQGEIDTLMSPIDSLKYYKHFLHTGMMSMDPHTGQIKAWVGGINHKYFKYDHVKQGRRQPGSTFKPIVYTAAIDNGYSPCFEVVDQPVTFQVVGDPPTWTPPNDNGKYSGESLTLRQGLARSVNSIAAKILQLVGTQTVVDYARRLGITSPLDAVPSLALGVSDVSVYEMVGAYGTFVNKGTWTEPYFITRIEDKNGNVLQEFTPKTREALSEESAYQMLYMLRGAAEEVGGSAVGLSYELKKDNEIGGKTGTSNNQSDGWFMGVTKDLVSGVWVGGDERSIHFRTLALGQGARMARPIFDKYMLKVYADSTAGYTKGPFERPDNPLSVELDCNKYQEADLQSESDTLDVSPVKTIDVNKDEIF
ncbi:penicillin-binding protein [Cytophagales bacterium RKSG123]|nr:penicillin-binding protein [Xanthovirga aplysinae]